jgi:hypothetical protein
MHARCGRLGATGGVSIYTLQRLARLLDHRKGIIADVESLMREDERRGLRASAVNVTWLQTLILDTVLGKITDDDDALLVVADGIVMEMQLICAGNPCASVSPRAHLPSVFTRTYGGCDHAAGQASFEAKAHNQSRRRESARCRRTGPFAGR